MFVLLAERYLFTSVVCALTPFLITGKLGVAPEIVEGVINALAFLLTEGARHNLTESDFGDSLVVLKLGDDLNEVLKQAFSASKDELRELLLEMSFSLPKYSDLDWRLDVQVRQSAT